MNLAAVETRDELAPGDVPSVMRAADGPGAEPGATFPPESVPRRRPRGVPIPRPVDPSVPLSPFGGIPEGVTHWRIRRRMLGGGWEALSHAEPGSIESVSVWPLAELSSATVQARWGGGRYQAQWVKPTAGGGSQVLRGGREVDIAAPTVEAPPAVQAPAASSMGPDFDRTMQLMRLISSEANDKTMAVMQFAAAMANARGGGAPSAAEAELAAIRQREAVTAAVTAAVAPLRAELAAVRAELDTDQGEDEGPGVLEAGAGAASSLLKGKGALVQAANFAASNPELVKAVLPMVLETASKIAALFATPKERPRGVPVAAPTLPHSQPQAAPQAPRAPRVEYTGPTQYTGPTHETVPVSSGDRTAGGGPVIESIPPVQRDSVLAGEFTTE